MFLIHCHDTIGRGHILTVRCCVGHCIIFFRTSIIVYTSKIVQTIRTRCVLYLWAVRHTCAQYTYPGWGGVYAKRKKDTNKIKTERFEHAVVQVQGWIQGEHWGQVPALSAKNNIKNNNIEIPESSTGY